MKIYKDLYWPIISPKTLFRAWEVFEYDKRNKPDVGEFGLDLEKNIFELYRDLKNGSYRHGEYKGFWIHDPKLRHIHKATVRDRVLHHAIFRVLNPIFEPTFIANSFSCRIGKGTHKGVEALRKMLRSESRNNTKTCYVLKCDIRKFFDSVDHDILLSILTRKIKDPDTIQLLNNIIESYTGTKSDHRLGRDPAVSGGLFKKRGIPIGNLTSQLFANVYMNEFDQFVKHTLKLRSYARYTDDFVVVSGDRKYLVDLVDTIRVFLRDFLSLELHPHKVEIIKYTEGVDFLGYVVFPTHTLIRKRTRKRIVRKFEGKIKEYREGETSQEKISAILASYLGVFSHANAYKLSIKLKNYFGLWISGD